jgi:sugar/nucleoside kinase (ribokinase family)
MQLDLIILGNLIVDDIVYEDGSTLMGHAGGAALYMGLTAPLWGLKTGVVSVAGTDFPVEMLTHLRERGVDSTGVSELPGPGLRTWLLYEDDVRRVVHRLKGATHLEASPGLEDLPEDWEPSAVHLAPMPMDLQRKRSCGLRDRFGDDVVLSLDPFEPLTEKNLDAWQRRASVFDLHFVSEDEMELRGGRADSLAALKSLFSSRLDTLFYKQGSKGGLALFGDGARHLTWLARAERVVDTTGAGDAFATGVLAGWIQGVSRLRAMEMGVVSASLAIEGQGVTGLLEATASKACTRLVEWFGR